MSMILNSTSKILPRWKQQLGGLFILLVSVGFTGWNWYTAFFKGYFNRKASLFFPACGILGLGLLLFPDYNTERRARGEDLSQLQGWRRITIRWWMILALALFAALANFIFLNS